MAGTWRTPQTTDTVVTITEETRHAGLPVVTDAQGHIVAVPPLPHEAEAVTVTTWQPLLIAMARGVAEAFVLAAVAVFTMLAAVPDADARAIVIVAGATFFTKLAAAFGFGTVDQRTATKV